MCWPLWTAPLWTLGCELLVGLLLSHIPWVSSISSAMKYTWALQWTCVCVCVYVCVCVSKWSGQILVHRYYYYYYQLLYSGAQIMGFLPLKMGYWHCRHIGMVFVTYLSPYNLSEQDNDESLICKLQPHPRIIITTFWGRCPRGWTEVTRTGLGLVFSHAWTPVWMGYNGLCYWPRGSGIKTRKGDSAFSSNCIF